MKPIKLNIMKLKLILIFATCFASLSFAQSPQSYSIYEYGDKLISCDTNFKNLFQNWNSEHIKNARDIKLISYKFVETIKDSIQIKKYIKQLTKPDVLLKSGKTAEQSGSDMMKKRECYVFIETFDEMNARLKGERKPEIPKEAFLSELKKTAGGLKYRIHIKDSIYVIKVQKEGKVFDNYVICNSKTFKVKCDNLFLGIQLWK